LKTGEGDPILGPKWRRVMIYVIQYLALTVSDAY